MATETTVNVTDDLDGSSGATTVTFSFDGKSMEIDLSAKNRKAFDKVLKPYIDAARSSSTARPSRRTVTRGAAPKTDLAAVRQWASDNGYQVSNRGRISAALLDAYQAAQ